MQITFNTMLFSIQPCSIYTISLILTNFASFFRLLQEDKNNLEALRMLALYSLCSEGNITEVNLPVSEIRNLKVNRRCL